MSKWLDFLQHPTYIGKIQSNLLSRSKMASSQTQAYHFSKYSVMDESNISLALFCFFFLFFVSCI
jgi:hypothetical protein